MRDACTLFDYRGGAIHIDSHAEPQNKQGTLRTAQLDSSLHTALPRALKHIGEPIHVTPLVLGLAAGQPVEGAVVKLSLTTGMIVERK